jgi:hypothetical protein
MRRIVGIMAPGFGGEVNLPGLWSTFSDPRSTGLEIEQTFD